MMTENLPLKVHKGFKVKPPRFQLYFKKFNKNSALTNKKLQPL